MSRKQQIFKISVLKKLSLQEKSCISVVPSTRLLALPPFFLNDMKSGIIYLLNSILKKYDRALDGIIIGYQNIKVLMDENTGIIPMGTAETEVNVSVEFYIFQPKIGNHLQGIVNKKSNNHIGCLVHKYFNATILKPEDVEYEDWICKDLDINDTIVFKVKDLDFTGLLPYIEGTIDDDEFNDILKEKRERVSNLGNSQLVSESEMCSEKCSVGLVEGLGVTVRQTKNEEEVDFATNDNIDRLLKNRLNKENPKLEEVDKVSESIKEKTSSAERKVAEDKVGTVDNSNGKKKRKKEKKGKDVGSSDVSLLVEDLLKARMGDVLGSKNTGQEEVDNPIKLVNEETEKKKKEKTKKKKEKKDKQGKGERSESVEKDNKCLPEKEDVIFHSTMLEPSSKKMEMTFCSPIPVEKTPGESRSPKKQREDATADVFKRDIIGKSKKEKATNRKRKDGGDEPNVGGKKLKISEETTAVKNKRLSESGDEKPKSRVERLLEEMHKEERDNGKQKYGCSDRESSSSERKAGRKKKCKREKEEESLYEKLMKQAISLINFTPEGGAEASEGSGTTRSEGKSKKEKGKRKRKAVEVDANLKNGSMYFLESSPEKVKEDKSLFSDSEISRSSPVKKKQGINGEVSGSEVAESKTPNGTKEEKRVKSERKEKRDKGKKKKKTGDEGEKEEDSLYEKLLKDAKSLIKS